MSASGLLVLDLDGTLCLGDAPVRRYARYAVESAADPAAVLDRVEAFLDGRDPVGGAEDGYRAVALLATESGVEREDLAAAFRRSRAEFDAWIDEVWAPPGVVELLDDLAGIRRVLVTNSPPDGLGRLLEALGVRRSLDAVLTDARKPAGMPAALDAAQASAPGAALASVGDIWVNDHAEVHARGGATFLIDRHRVPAGDPTARAERIEELYPAIRAWAADVRV